ncbi:putative N6-adenine-specific DNA methylase [Chryseobacterium defluvii]|uniref:Putative N6-adenine-specific DNA methylase n=1 Tax=Chryseobacterium defluvii TaxID=160396 RepID=A0A495SNS0_9FLAO|nr:putative N6-adenine-specific DNA methylase [Chryseobacterium defluvii]
MNIEAAEMEEVIEVKKQNFFDSSKDLFPLLIVFIRLMMRGFL